MARKVLISLVGGRPLPNILFILNEKPEKLYLISSRDSANKGGNKEKLIQALPNSFNPETFDVDPYKIIDTMNIFQKILSDNSDDDIIVQLSSEPTTMALAAYKFVLDSQKEIKLYYSSRDGVIDIFDKESFPKKLSISLTDYFKVYGWSVEFKNTHEKDWDDLVNFFVKEMKISQTLLSRIRKAKEHVDKSNDDFFSYSLFNLQPNQVELLVEMEKLGFILEFKDNHLKIKKDKAAFFDTGDWLEYYVFMSAKQLGFDEIAWNVEDKSGKGELDFVGICEGQLVLASCKTSKIESSHLQQLSARAEQLGKGMCSKLIISSTSPNAKEKENHKKWKEEYQVDFVYADDLANIKDKIKNAKESKNRI